MLTFYFFFSFFLIHQTELPDHTSNLEFYSSTMKLFLCTLTKFFKRRLNTVYIFFQDMSAT